MELISTDQKIKCFHCGDECTSEVIQHDSKRFCCNGCKSVYDILQSSGLTAYYQLESSPGIPGTLRDEQKFSYLTNREIALRLLDFSSENLEKIRFSIPGIHCSSCIWLLENLRSIHQGILTSRANLSERELAVDYDPSQLNLKELVQLLTSIGYEPTINLERHKSQEVNSAGRTLILKIAVAGFCFGNIMLLSFPEYLGLDFGIDDQLAFWFSWITLILSLPVLFYCAQGYFQSAINGLNQKFLNIDVPITLGIVALAGWSYYEIIFQVGSGYLDSLAGLLFLLLIGQWFQHKTYTNLSFNRDFKSYFPLAVNRVENGEEKVVLVEKLQPEDTIVVRHEELIPADSILLDKSASIDYSFVSGESQLVTRHRGELIFAGGKHIGTKGHYQIKKHVSQSYLTQLWNHQAFNNTKYDARQLLINGISKYFTTVILLVAVCAAGYWLLVDPSRSLFVFTSVLIVACPCALAMATPFTLGHAVRAMGKNRLFLKNAQVLNQMSKIDSIIFDKTGTLTNSESRLTFDHTFTNQQARLVAALTENSNHPVSQNITSFLKSNYPANGYKPVAVDYREYPGKGISAKIEGRFVQVSNSPKGTSVAIDQEIIGYFQYETIFREGLSKLLTNLAEKFTLTLLSGDRDHQKEYLSKKFPWIKALHFSKSPMDKLEFVETLQHQGDTVMMLGDGLNDAGALKRSDVGLAVTENPQHFTPASDGILHATALGKLSSFMKLASWSQYIIIMGIGLSFLYNVVGLSFAVSGKLTPLTAAVLMPISSISVVVFTTLAVKIAAVKLKLT